MTVRALSPAEIDTARADLDARGFCVLDFSGDRETLALCDAAWADAADQHAGRYNRVMNGWRRAPGVRALAAHPGVEAFLAAAYAAEPFAFQTLTFERGSEQAPHADSFHFTADPIRRMCGVWFALEDIDDDAGPLIVYPLSHSLALISPSELDADGKDVESLFEAYQVRVSELISELHPERLAIKKGQAIVWASNLVHGGAPQRDAARTRRSQVTHYFFRGDDYYTLVHSAKRRRRRLPTDVSTGRFVWPRGGPPAARDFARAVADRVRRRVARFAA